jgi:hypothetical protein
MSRGVGSCVLLILFANPSGFRCRDVLHRLWNFSSCLLSGMMLLVWVDMTHLVVHIVLSMSYIISCYSLMALLVSLVSSAKMIAAHY